MASADDAWLFLFRTELPRITTYMEGLSMTNRRLVAAIAATAILSSVFCINSCNTASADQTINYGVQPDTDPSFIAKALGLFKPIERKHHVKIVFRRFSYGAPENQAMGAGALQIASAGMGPAVVAASRLPSTLIAINILEQTAIIVPSDSPLKSPCGLKGKTVAYPGDGSQQYPLLLKALATCGLGRNDISLFKSSGPDIPTLVENKSVDAGITWDPSISVGLATGKVRILAKAEDIMPIMNGHYVGNGIYVSNRFLKSHSDITQELVTANVEAINYILCHPNKAAKLWHKQIGISEHAIQLSLNKGISVYSLNVIPTRSTLDAYTKFLRDAHILKSSDEPKIDPSFATIALKKVKEGKTCKITGE